MKRSNGISRNQGDAKFTSSHKCHIYRFVRHHHMFLHLPPHAFPTPMENKTGKGAIHTS